jgi:hypothetical protein
MKLKLTSAILAEMEGAMSDSLRLQGTLNEDPSNETYRKIHAAMKSAEEAGRKTVYFEADDKDVKELLDRIDFEIGPNGTCTINIGEYSDFSERAYWLGRKRAYAALLKQIKSKL